MRTSKLAWWFSTFLHTFLTWLQSTITVIFEMMNLSNASHSLQSSPLTVRMSHPYYIFSFLMVFCNICSHSICFYHCSFVHLISWPSLVWMLSFLLFLLLTFHLILSNLISYTSCLLDFLSFCVNKDNYCVKLNYKGTS